MNTTEKKSAISHKRYPHCSQLGVLRRNHVGGYVVSTGALYRALGWQAYQRYLPMMQHASNTGPTPESCERFLEGLNGK